MFIYENIQSPTLPCPVIDLTVFSLMPGPTKINTKAIIDTGASISCVSLGIISQIDKKRLMYHFRPVKGFAGSQVMTKIYYLNLQIKGCVFRDIEMAATDREYSIIGRDIINKYKIVLNAPDKIWEVIKQ